MQNGHLETAESLTESINSAANYIASLCSGDLSRPQVGIICGSGLSKLGGLLESAITIPYSHIPNFPRSTVEGHQNALKVGKLNGIVCMVFLGRFHAYEGHHVRSTTLPVRVMAKMGVPNLIITNSSGSLNSEACKVGDFMVIEDHISFPNFSGISPLVGPNLGEFGARFPPLNDAYHKSSFEWVQKAAKAAAVPLEIIKKGIYVHIGGPSYETPAEVRCLRMLGGSAVGMSTVPEVIVAAHCQQIKTTVALALITNESVVDGAAGPTHEEVLQVAAARSLEFMKLIVELVGIIAK